MIVKFNSSSVPAYVTTDILVGVTPGYRVKIGGSDIRISNGDLLEVVDNIVLSVVKASEFTSTFSLRHYIRQKVGRKLVDDILEDIEALSDANEADLINRITPVLNALLSGSIRGARVIANATATGGQLTAQRKADLLTRIDTALAIIT